MKTNSPRMILAVAAALLIANASPIQAVIIPSYEVDWSAQIYPNNSMVEVLTPSQLTINQGETVRWVNMCMNDMRNVTITSDAPVGDPDYFSFFLTPVTLGGLAGFHTFNSPGTFTYHTSYSASGSVAVIPEPGVLALCGLGLSGLIVRFRSKRVTS